MNKPLSAIVSFVLLCAALLLLYAAPERQKMRGNQALISRVRDQEAARKRKILDELNRSAEKERKTEELKKKIKTEFSATKGDNWAGEYFSGGALGAYISVWIAPENGFVVESGGCLGVYDRNLGKVQIKDGLINLKFEIEKKRDECQEISQQFIPVKWGERYYLIATDEVVDFCNAANQGLEQNDWDSGLFLAKNTGDQTKKVTGLPPLPKKYQPYLLKKPIQAEIVKIVKSKLTSSNTDWKVRESVVILNVGKKHGILKGMELVVRQPNNFSESVTVTKVLNETCEGVMVQMGEEVPPPKAGWKLSTANQYKK